MDTRSRTRHRPNRCRHLCLHCAADFTAPCAWSNVCVQGWVVFISLTQNKPGITEVVFRPHVWKRWRNAKSQTQCAKRANIRPNNPCVRLQASNCKTLQKRSLARTHTITKHQPTDDKPGKGAEPSILLNGILVEATAKVNVRNEGKSQGCRKCQELPQNACALDLIIGISSSCSGHFSILFLARKFHHVSCTSPVPDSNN